MTVPLRISAPAEGGEVKDSRVANLQRTLARYAPTAMEGHSVFVHALREAVSRPGSLVRAELILRTANNCGLASVAADQLACALEFWHVASLLFDDLPSMDDARERRGRPCLHLRFGEANAILVALSLINRGYSLIGEVFSGHPVEVQRRAISMVESAVGPAGLIGGQSRDLNYTSAEPVREIGRIAWQKTGMLFWLSLGLPALAAHRTSAELRDLRALSVYWGLAYQALDDLVDFREGGRDACLDRPNLAFALGAGAVERQIRSHLARARFRIARMENLEPHWAFLRHWQTEAMEPRVHRVIGF